MTNFKVSGNAVEHYLKSLIYKIYALKIGTKKNIGK